MKVKASPVSLITGRKEQSVKMDAINVEARRIIRWNKRRLNKQARRRKDTPSGKSGYKKTGYDARMFTRT